MNHQIKDSTIKLKALSADEQARDAYERRLKGIRDFNMHISDAEERGRAKGETNKARSVAVNLLTMGMSIEQIVTATGLPVDEIEAIKAS